VPDVCISCAVLEEPCPSSDDGCDSRVNEIVACEWELGLSLVSDVECNTDVSVGSFVDEICSDNDTETPEDRASATVDITVGVECDCTTVFGNCC